jgi:hypothetical protein
MKSNFEIYSEGTLSEILEFWPLIDKSDSYQVYALYSMIDCECSKCADTLMFHEPIDQGSPKAWAARTAEHMRASGWFVPPVRDDRYDLRPLCPKCVKAAERSQRPQ